MVAIIIIGILSVAALPKFIDFQEDAETAALEGVKASIESVVDLIYAKSIIEGVHKTEYVNFSGYPKITVNDNQQIRVTYGYPRSSGTVEWLYLLNMEFGEGEGFIVGVKQQTLYIRPDHFGDIRSNPVPTDCYVSYKEPTAAGQNPTINLVPC